MNRSSFAIRAYYLTLAFYFAELLTFSFENFNSVKMGCGVYQCWLPKTLTAWIGYPYLVFYGFVLLGLLSSILIAGKNLWGYWRFAPVLCFVMTFFGGSHSYNSFILPALAACFLPSKWFFDSARRWEVYRAMLATLLFSYFASGLWKILHIVSSDMDYNILQKLIFEVYADHKTASIWILDFFGKNSLVLYLIYVLHILFQLILPLALFYRSLIVPFGVLLVFFHVGTFEVLDVNFPHNILLIATLMLTQVLCLGKRNEEQSPNHSENVELPHEAT